VVSVSGSGTPYTSPLTLAGLVAFDNSDPSNVALYSNVAYVCGSDRIVMVDVTTATAPTVIGEFGDSVLKGYGDRCSVNANGANPLLVDIYGSPLGDQESMAVYSLANPRAPVLLSTVSSGYGHLENLSFSGNYGIVTTSYITYYTKDFSVAAQTGDFLVFDFTNPSQVLLAGTLQPSSAAGSGNQNLKPWSAVVNPSYAYVASSTATGTSTAGAAILDVIGISSPAGPTPVSQVNTSQAAIFLSFDVSGNTLLAAGSTMGQRNPGKPDFDFTGSLTLTAMDVSNVALPQVVSTLTTTMQVNGTFNTVAFTNGFFAIVNNPPVTDNYGPSTLMIADARNPSNILLYPFQTQFGLSGMVATTTGFLLAPTALGLNIYSLQY
jgi:hypothetical protein